jgi:hypothetical protein
MFIDLNSLIVLCGFALDSSFYLLTVDLLFDYYFNIVCIRCSRIMYLLLFPL